MNDMKDEPIDLGWTVLSEDSLNVSDDRLNNENPFYSLNGFYGRLFSQEEDRLHRYGRYKLTSPYYISEIEDTLRFSLLLFEKIAIETPSPTQVLTIEGSGASASFYSDTYFMEDEYGVSCDYSFFTTEALRYLTEHLGDAIQNKEIALLPSFIPSWEDPVEGDEWEPPSMGSNIYAVGDILRPLNYAWPKLSQCQSLEFQDNLVATATDEGLATPVPILIGGNIRDLILLRRDEYESFSRWRKYLDEIVSSKNYKNDHVIEALNERFKELCDRIALLKRKGFLDAIGAMLRSAGAIIAFSVDSVPATLSGSLITASAAVSAIKSLVEQKAEKEKIRRENLYFFWLTRKLHKWN